MKLKPVENDPVIRFLPGTLSAAPEEVVRYLAGSRYKADPKTYDLLPATIEQAIHLTSPVFVYRLNRVTALDTSGRLIMESGLSLEVPQVERHPDTRYLASCVCSLGAAIENCCRGLSHRGQLFQAMLLDAAGVSLLDALANKSHELLSQRARGMQLFAGCPFGPGYQDMPIETQSLLFQLVDAGAIQVTLNESLVMEPMKSLSFFVRLSATENRRGPTVKCRRCHMKDCQFRGER